MLRVPTVLLLQADSTASFLVGRVLARVAQVDNLLVARTTPTALAYLRELPPPKTEQLLILLDPYRQPRGGYTFLAERTRQELAPQAVVVSLFIPGRPELGGRPPTLPAAAQLAYPVQQEELQATLRLFFSELGPASK